MTLVGDSVEFGLRGEGLAHILRQQIGDIDTEAIYPAIGPEAQRLQEVSAHLRMIPVEVRLFDGELVQVELPVADWLPGRATEYGAPIGRRFFLVWPDAVAEHITIPLRGTRAGSQRLTEPAMEIGGVVRHDIDDDADAGGMECRDHLVKLLKSANLGVNIAIIVHVVAAISQRRRIERRQPHGVDAEVYQVGNS